MNNQTGNAVATVPKPGSLAERRAALAAKAAEIEEIASGAMIHFTQAGSMADELAVAQAIVDLRRALTPEVMTPILALMNTDLGFKTDRDPNQINSKTNQPNVPYSADVVRDVVIEAKLRGFRAVGNEFNIIAGRFYAAQNGFFRKLTDGKSFPGLSNFRDSYGLPKMGTNGATVVAKATWTLAGKPDSYEQEFGIRVNASMGADAVLGKARRKLCKRVHDILLGINTPDAEVGDDDGLKRVDPLPQDPPQGFNPDEGDDDQIPGAEAPKASNVRVVVEAPVVHVAPTPPAQPAAPATQETQAPTPEPATTSEPRTTRRTTRAKAPEPVQSELAPHGEPAAAPAAPVAAPSQEGGEAPIEEHPSLTLGRVVTSAGFTFDQFKASPAVYAWFDGVGTRPKADDVNEFEDVPRHTALALLGNNNGASVVAQLKRENAIPSARV
jgi:hypothetical protein